MQCYDQPNQFIIIQEYCAWGNLHERLRKKGQFTQYEVHHILNQALEGLKVLHEDYGIIHRDIKTENILIYS